MLNGGRKIIKKGITAVLGAVTTAAMVFGLPMTSLASNRTSIGSVSITVSSEIEVGSTSSDVEVTSNNSLYDVYNVSVTNVPSDGWDPDDNPKVQIKLELSDSDDYQWSVTKSNISVSGDSGTVSFVSGGSGHGYLTIVYTLADLDEIDTDWEENMDLDIDDTAWNSSYGIAKWSAAEAAKKYEVKLYRGSTLLTSVTTTSTAYDFANYFTQAGTYSFKVRAVYSSKYKGDWETSDDLYVTTSQATAIASTYNASYNSTTVSYNSYEGSLTSTVTNSGSGLIPGNTTDGTWIQTQYGFWYRNSDGSWTSNGWQEIDGKWYYFNAYGYRKSGWIYWNNKWYYCGADGAMLTNAYTPDGYYVNAAGVWTTIAA